MPSNFQPKDGQYYYSPHRSVWGLWKHHELGNGISEGEFIMDCETKEKAVEMVKSLNGWFG